MHLIKNKVFIYVLICIASCANAQKGQCNDALLEQFQELNIAKPQIHILANGMTLLLVEDHREPIISFQLKIDAEPILEGEIAGLVDLFGELLLSGTTEMSSSDIAGRIESLGASIHVYSDGFYANSLKQNANELLTILHAISVDCNFPPEEFEKAKIRLLSGISTKENDPEDISKRVGDLLRFKSGHPYGLIPTEESVYRIHREHVKAYYDRFFVPENAYFVVVGDINSSEMLELVNRTFNDRSQQLEDLVIEENGSVDQLIGSLTKISELRKFPAPPKNNQVVFVGVSGAVESVIDISYPILLTPNDPNLLITQVMNNVLGSRALKVRLNKNYREDSDYSYSAYSTMSADKFIGSFSAHASVPNNVTDTSITQILYEMQHMIEFNVNDEELEMVKKMMADRYMISRDDPKTIARQTLNTILYDLDPDYYQGYLMRLDTTSVAAVRAMAINYLKPKNAHILIVGDKEEVANNVSKFADHSGIRFLDKHGKRYREEMELPPPGVKADHVINDYLAAIGGRSRLIARRSEVIIMTTEINGELVNYTMYRKYPNKYMARMTLNGNELEKVIYNGIRGVSSKGGQTSELVDVELDELGYEADMNFNMSYQQLSFDVRLIGVTKVKGKEAYKIHITTGSGIPIIEYYDIKTKLKLKMVELEYTEDGKKTITTYFDDHRSAQGILYPHTITQFADQKLVFKVQSIELDQDLSDDLFFIP